MQEPAQKIKNKKVPSKSWLKRHNKLVIAVLLLVVILLFDLSPFGGNIKFYSKWIECGRKPVVGETAIGGGVSWYETPSSFQPVRPLSSQKYFCTPQQAEQAGYSSSPDIYEFKYK